MIFPEDWWWDEPTRIFEIIKEDSDEWELINKFNNQVIEKIGREKIREFSKKRWDEYLEEHRNIISPEQKIYFEYNFEFDKYEGFEKYES